MSEAKTLRARAWETLRTRYWNAFVAGFIVTIISGIASAVSTSGDFVSEFINLLRENGSYNTTKIVIILSVVLIFLSVLTVAVSIFINGPLMVGAAKFFTENTEQTPEITVLFWGFKNAYIRNVKTMFLTEIKIFLWTLLFIIPGIIKVHEYALIPYILAEHPEFTSNEAFAYTRNMMQGKKGSLFTLGFSFIGWILLSLLTCGIGYIFLVPYMEAAYAEFYVEAKNVMTE